MDIRYFDEEVFLPSDESDQEESSSEDDTNLEHLTESETYSSVSVDWQINLLSEVSQINSRVNIVICLFVILIFTRLTFSTWKGGRR